MDIVEGWGFVTKDLKLKIYPAVIGVLGICLIASLFANVQIEINRGMTPIEPPELDRSPATSPNLPPRPIASPSPLPSNPEAPALAASTEQLPSIGVTAQGGLRVSNQTEYPLRVALLSQQTAGKPPVFSQPVHWDFAPQEGETKGLILSLPNQNLQLQSGDVLVAFAQDGSRRYWGPYVVGETSLPVWNANTKEWQLILQP